jgi:hypothetical protein
MGDRVGLSRNEKIGIVAIVGVAVFVIGGALVIGLGAALIVQQGVFDDFVMPDESYGDYSDYDESPFPEPGVHVANLPVQARMVFEDDSLSLVSEFVLEAERIGMAGADRVVYADYDFEKTTSWSYPAYAHPTFVDFDGDGVHEVAAYSEDSVQLLDAAGKVQWEVPGDFSGYPPFMGDVDGDGALEMVIQSWDSNIGRSTGYLSALFSGLSGGIHESINVIDADGELIRGGPVTDLYELIAVLDTNDDEIDDILYWDYDDNLIICDSGLQERSRVTTSYDFYNTSVKPWPAHDGDPHFVNRSASPVTIMDMDGETVQEYEAAGANLEPVHTTTWQPRPGDPPLFAIVVHSWQHGSALYIYDGEGTLVYEEVVEGSFCAMTTYTPEGATGETLLIGGDGEVWAYSLD